MFKRILIANRGEIAVRIIRAAAEMGIESVAVYSEADRLALHTRRADFAYPIGPSPAKDSYLNIERILEPARISGAESIHPGYGFLAENADFAQAVADVPRRTRTVDLSSTGSIQYIPEIWEPKFAVKFYPTTFMSQITNTDYQGSLQKMGDKVRIRVNPTVSTFKYTKNMDISTKNTATYSDSIEFPIERGIGWRVPVNKVDQKQSDMDYLGELMNEGALNSKIDIETKWLAEYYTEAASYNKGATAGMKSSSYNIGSDTGATPIGIDQTNALTINPTGVSEINGNVGRKAASGAVLAVGLL